MVPHRALYNPPVLFVYISTRPLCGLVPLTNLIGSTGAYIPT